MTWSDLHHRKRAPFQEAGRWGHELGYCYSMLRKEIIPVYMKAVTVAVRQRLGTGEISDQLRLQKLGAFCCHSLKQETEGKRRNVNVEDGKSSSGHIDCEAGVRQRSEVGYTRNLESPNSQRQKVEWWLQGLERGNSELVCDGYRVSDLQNERSSMDGWMVVMVVQQCKCTLCH